MKSGKICNTSLKTIGRVKKQGGATIQWTIGDGGLRVDGVSINRPYKSVTTWRVCVCGESLDKVITFLQKVRDEARN